MPELMHFVYKNVLSETYSDVFTIPVNGINISAKSFRNNKNALASA